MLHVNKLQLCDVVNLLTAPMCSFVLKVLFTWELANRLCGKFSVFPSAYKALYLWLHFFSDASSRCSGRRRCASRNKRSAHHDGLPLVSNFIPVSSEILRHVTHKISLEKGPLLSVMVFASLFRKSVASHVISGSICWHEDQRQISLVF